MSDTGLEVGRLERERSRHWDQTLKKKKTTIKKKRKNNSAWTVVRWGLLIVSPQAKNLLRAVDPAQK